MENIKEFMKEYGTKIIWGIVLAVITFGLYVVYKIIKSLMS